MEMENMREEFEVWCCERGFTLKPAETNCGVLIDGQYGHPRVQLAWESWKASRAALCVELPNEEVPGRFDGDGETGYVNGYNSSLSDVKEHLRFHGVTYK